MEIDSTSAVMLLAVSFVLLVSTHAVGKYYTSLVPLVEHRSIKQQGRWQMLD